MKLRKILAVTIIAMIGFFLTACSASLDGTYNAYKYDSGSHTGTLFTLTIKGNDAELEMELSGNGTLYSVPSQDLKGELDTSEKIIKFKRNDEKQELSYEVKGNILVLDGLELVSSKDKEKFDQNKQSFEEAKEKSSESYYSDEP